jgi:hypothetical protein
MVGQRRHLARRCDINAGVTNGVDRTEMSKRLVDTFLRKQAR